jgi:hypothetical protein
MPAIIEGPPEPDDLAGPRWKRWAWFAGLALVAGMATALAAYGLEALLPRH